MDAEHFQESHNSTGEPFAVRTIRSSSDLEASEAERQMEILDSLQAPPSTAEIAGE